MKRRNLWTILITIAGLLIIAYGLRQSIFKPSNAFDGQRALADVQQQVDFGPRIPGSAGHSRTVDWMKANLQSAGWQVEEQSTSLMGHPIRNIIAKRGSGPQWIIFGAHYDTRQFADQDPNPDFRSTPVPGANDGASGVAVLMEMARTLPQGLQKEVWLVFFDAEDQGDIPGWDWILGSRAFANSLQKLPTAVVVVDMIGDADLNIYQERNSTRALSEQIWASANKIGYAQQFPAQYKFSMLDDHTPFLERNIPAVDLIDFDYPYWHTTADTPDKVSAQSLQAVGNTLQHWILSQ